MTDNETTACPGCGLVMPKQPQAVNTSYFNASAECWTLFGEVLAAEYSNALLFGQVHQLTVDAYAAQHAGGAHPDKSVAIHLIGLHLVLVDGLHPMRVAPRLQRIATDVTQWPRLEPPRVSALPTIFDVAMAAGEVEAHISAVRRWAAHVWSVWERHHALIAQMAGGAAAQSADA